MAACSFLPAACPTKKLQPGYPLLLLGWRLRFAQPPPCGVAATIPAAPLRLIFKETYRQAKTKIIKLYNYIFYYLYINKIQHKPL